MKPNERELRRLIEEYAEACHAEGLVKAARGSTKRTLDACDVLDRFMVAIIFPRKS